MAEINFNNLYNQLSPMDKMFYDQQFQKKYNPNQENIILSSQPSYEQMKSAYDAQQQVPEKSFISSAMSALNPFSELSAAEIPQVPNVSLGTPKINFNTGITSASNAIPNINGVPIINTGALNQDLQNTDLVNQIIAANQAANVNKFGNTVAPFTGNQINSQINNQVPEINNQMPFNDFYGSVYEPYNEEKDDEQVDYLPGQSSFKDKISNIGSSFMKKSGIGGLLGLITGNPLIGLIGRGIGALVNRAGPSFGDFRSSNTLAEFAQKMRDRKARNDAAARGAAKANMAEARAITNRISKAKVSNQDSYRGGGGGGGGIGSSRGGGASPGSAGPGGSDSMGSF